MPADPAMVDAALSDYREQLAALHHLAATRDDYLRNRIRAPARITELVAAVAAQRARVQAARGQLANLLGAP